MRKFCFAAPFSVAAALASAAAQPLADPALEAKARAIHEKVLTLDTHVDIPENFVSADVDPGTITKSQVDLPKMRAGGLDAAFFIVYTGQGPLTPEGYASALKTAEAKADAIQRMADAYPAQVEVALTAADAKRIHASGKRVALIGMENAYPLGPSVEDVGKWYKAGVRYMGITHFGHNQFGDSSNPNKEFGDEDAKYGGLSELGQALIAANNRAGVMVDVSHSGRETMMQAVALSKAPIIASHSGVKAIADTPRNLDDEQLRAIAANGGVAQIVALDEYVKPFTAEQKAFREALAKELKLDTPAGRAAATPETRAEYEKRIVGMWAIAPRATVADFVDHIDHAVKVAGIDHVGVASDFDGGGGVSGWENATQTLNVTRELVKRGYTEEQIRKIWGGNLLRVMADVEKAAKKLQ
ncbi:MAG: dipeptidase [Pseudomonadota bacterium]|nr:dipeptidase [Pseudomonadota bacterium]